MGNNMVHRKADKDGLDFYETPRVATVELLKREGFTGSIWEPAAGKGAIVKVLQEPGHTHYPHLMNQGHSVLATDIHDYGCGYKLVDFLTVEDQPQVNHVITNPPFVLAQQFVEKALMVARRKVAMLLRIQFLEGKARYHFFKRLPPKTVYVFSRRISCSSRKVRMMTFAWFIWDHRWLQHAEIKQPTIKWILPGGN